MRRCAGCKIPTKNSMCKSCLRAYHRHHYLLHKKDILEKCRAYKEKNPERVKIIKKRYVNTHPWYRHLEAAKRRCNNPKTNKYYLYGGKGIRCLMNTNEIREIWFRDEAFNLSFPSIDRIDSNKNYTKDNVRFIEHKENSRLGSLKRWAEKKEKQ